MRAFIRGREHLSREIASFRIAPISAVVHTKLDGIGLMSYSSSTALRSNKESSLINLFKDHIQSKTALNRELTDMVRDKRTEMSVDQAVTTLKKAAQTGPASTTRVFQSLHDAGLTPPVKPLTKEDAKEVMEPLLDYIRKKEPEEKLAPILKEILAKLDSHEKPSTKQGGAKQQSEDKTNNSEQTLWELFKKLINSQFFLAVVGGAFGGAFAQEARQVIDWAETQFDTRLKMLKQYYNGLGEQIEGYVTHEGYKQNEAIKLPDMRDILREIKQLDEEYKILNEAIEKYEKSSSSTTLFKDKHVESSTIKRHNDIEPPEPPDF